MGTTTNEIEFRFEAPPHIRGLKLRDAVRDEARKHAHRAGAITFRDPEHIGAMELRSGMLEHIVRVTLVFDDPPPPDPESGD